MGSIYNNTLHNFFDGSDTYIILSHVTGNSDMKYDLNSSNINGCYIDGTKDYKIISSGCFGWIYLMWVWIYLMSWDIGLKYPIHVIEFKLNEWMNSMSHSI